MKMNVTQAAAQKRATAQVLFSSSTVLGATIKVIAGILITAIACTIIILCVCCCVVRYRKYRERRVAPEPVEKQQAKPDNAFTEQWRSMIKTLKPKNLTLEMAEEKLIQPSEVDSDSLTGLERRVWFINKLMQRQNEMKESHLQ